MINLDKQTRCDAASSFCGLEKVPKKAITMGIQTIMNAKQIFILAFSETKAKIVQKSIEGPLRDDLPATFL